MPETIYECTPIVGKLIEKNTQDKIKFVLSMNRSRHMLFITERGLKYWMLFKREFFLSFGKIFNMKGCGDSINANILGKALSQDIDGIIFIYRKGYVYFMSPREILDFGKKFGTIRVTKKTHERTYSFPLRAEKRWR